LGVEEKHERRRRRKRRRGSGAAGGGALLARGAEKENATRRTDWRGKARKDAADGPL